MASSNVSAVTNHFPTANEGFTTTLASTILSGAATVPLNSTSGLTNGTVFVGIIEPGQAKEQTFTGTVDTGGAQITGVKWTRGTNADHTAGVTIVDYVSGTGNNMFTKGILVEHNQDGTHDEALIQSRTADTTPASGDLILTSDVSASNALKKVTLANLFATPPVTSGTMSATDWKEGVLPAQSGTITNNGNRSYDIPFASTVASLLSPGMRIRTTRTVTAPTYMGGAFNGTNHYFTKVTATSTLSTVTNNWTIMGWVEPTAYAAGYLAGRSDAAANNCFGIGMSASGQITAIVTNGGVANVRTITSYQSLPLNKKTHVAVTWTGGTVVMYLDGISIPVQAATTGGTAPTTAGTGGDWSIGRLGGFTGGGTYFGGGYLSGFGVFDAVLTASTIKSYSSQVLSGSETNCIGAWSLNNTGVNQQAAGTNDLTATNSVSYTVRSPYGTDGSGVSAGTTDYALVMKVSTTTATVQVPEGCTIPTSGGVSAVAYSTTANPYGWVADKDRWNVQLLVKASTLQAAATTGTVYNPGGLYISAPVGSFMCDYSILGGGTGSTSVDKDLYVGLSTSNSSFSTGVEAYSHAYFFNTVFVIRTTLSKSSVNLEQSAITPYYINFLFSGGGTLTNAGWQSAHASMVNLFPQGI